MIVADPMHNPFLGWSELINLLLWMTDIHTGVGAVKSRFYPANILRKSKQFRRLRTILAEVCIQGFL